MASDPRYASPPTPREAIVDFGTKAGLLDVLSNNSDVTFTPDQLRKLAESSGSREATPPPIPFKVHQLSKRLSTEQIDEVVQRYEAGASAGSLARELGIATSALLRLLRERNVVVRRRLVTAETEQSMAQEYKAGMTVAELQPAKVAVPEPSRPTSRL